MPRAPPTPLPQARDGSIPLDSRISQSPNFIADRSQFGHWEGDLLIFRRDLGEANVTSLVERKSRYTVIIKNGSRHSRRSSNKIIDAFSPLPAFARQSFHLRPWYRVSRFQAFGRWDRCQELVLRSEFTVAERLGTRHLAARPGERRPCPIVLICSQIAFRAMT